MDKLLLSPENSNNENVDGSKIEKQNQNETIKIEEEIPAKIDPISPVSPNIPSSLKSSLLEFLSFKSKDENHMCVSSSFISPDLSFLSTPRQFVMPQLPEAPLQVQVHPKLNLSNPTISPQIRNVIASANLHCKLNLKRIAMFAQNVEYNPKRLPALYMLLRQPRALATIFSNGKMLCSGSSSVHLSHQAARRFARIIQKLGYPVKFQSYKVENIVASCDVKFHIRLELLELFVRGHCIYEPELYPALIYRLSRSRCQISIFPSGQIVLSGVKKSNEFLKSFREIYPLLKGFEK